MRNLNKQQIDAITDKVISELNIASPAEADIAKMRTEFKKEWNAFRKGNDRKVLEKYGYKRVDIGTVCENKTLNGFIYKPNNTYKAIDTIHIPDGEQKVGIYPVKAIDRHAIKNEIVLAQLEADNLADLLDIVKDKVAQLVK